MKKKWLQALFISSVLISALSCSQTVSEAPKKIQNFSIKSSDNMELNNFGDSLAYLLSRDIVRFLEGQWGSKVDYDVLLNALAWQMSVDSLPVDMKGLLESIQRSEMKDQVAKQSAFFAENRTKPGIQETSSGIQYKILTKGRGKKPALTDKVKVHYTGTLIDGTKFDSSLDRGEPATFGLNQVIRGWGEILQEMPVGSKWIVYIPFELGYGETPQASIPAYSTLIFEIELLDIVK